MQSSDRTIIRELAKQYAALANSEEQQRANRRMKASNDLLIVRPPVLIDEIPWNQLTSDPEIIRKETENTVKLCLKYGYPLEFVLKDISTVSRKPENLTVWANTVSDVLDQYYEKA